MRPKSHAGFDVVVFDTAPTGWLIRSLSFKVRFLSVVRLSVRGHFRIYIRAGFRVKGQVLAR